MKVAKLEKLKKSVLLEMKGRGGEVDDLRELGTRRRREERENLENLKLTLYRGQSVTRQMENKKPFKRNA